MTTQITVAKETGSCSKANLVITHMESLFAGYIFSAIALTRQKSSPELLIGQTQGKGSTRERSGAKHNI